MSSLHISSIYNNRADTVLFPGNAEHFLPTIPDQTVKLVVSSPPYNLGKEYEDHVDIDDYLQNMKNIIEVIDSKITLDGSICWQVGNYVNSGEVYPLDIQYYPIFKDLGYKLRNRIIWHYGHGLHASTRFSGRYETILWFTKGDNYTFNLDPVRIPSKYPGKRHYQGENKGKPSGNPKGKNPSDVWRKIMADWEEGIWDIPNVKSRHAEKTIHPCQFPVALVERCILALTDEGDHVLDPFAGVGSTLIAALKNNRLGLGSEKEKAYVDLALSRLQLFWDGNLKLRPLGKPVYQPKSGEKVAQIPEEWLDEDTDSIYKD